MALRVSVYAAFVAAFFVSGIAVSQTRINTRQDGISLPCFSQYPVTKAHERSGEQMFYVEIDKAASVFGRLTVVEYSLKRFAPTTPEYAIRNAFREYVRGIGGKVLLNTEYYLSFFLKADGKEMWGAVEIHENGSGYTLSLVEKQRNFGTFSLNQR